jgi:hypothetical protein
MTTENLKQTLLELHRALAAGDPLDPEMVALLELLDTDIQSRLAQQERTTLPEENPLTTRAQEISARFAARHPRLEPVLRELTDTLQRIGI